MLGRRWRSFALTALLLLPWRTGAEAAPIGFVLSFHGAWQVDGQSVRQGQPVFPSAKLALAPGVRFDATKDLPWTITVVLLDNTTCSLSCGSAVTCAGGLALPESLGGPTSVLTKLVDAFRRIFANPDRYASLLSRGGSGDQNLTDAVARLDAGRIRLAPLLQAVASGQYRLQFKSTQQPTGPERREAVIDIEWSRSDTSYTRPSDLVPGLYRVSLLSVDHFAEPVGREAWVLVAAATTYESSRAAFERATTLASTWKTQVPAQDIDRFLRAYLASLAEQQ
jgi:hypothetical protein